MSFDKRPEDGERQEDPRQDTPQSQSEQTPSAQQPTEYTAAPGAIHGEVEEQPASKPAPQQAPQAPQPPTQQPVQPPRYQQGPPQPPQGYRPQGPPQQPYGQQQFRPPYPPPGPGGQFGPPQKNRNRALPIIIGVVLLVLVLGGGLITLAATMMGGSSSGAGSSSLGFFGEKIAVLDIGVIMEDDSAYNDTKALISQVNAWADNDSVKAMVLRVNSPGGAVSATQDLYYALEQFRSTGKPILTSMGDVAASGGFYAAMASDEVYANEGTLTGSIGVILNFMNYEGLQDKIGVASRPVKSGQFKDIGSGSRPMSPEEQALLQEMVLDVFEQFFDVVYEARLESVRNVLSDQKDLPLKSISDEMVEEYIRGFADGRIFSGRQAVEYGLIDGNLTLDEVVERARVMTKSPNAGILRAPNRPARGLFGSMSSLATKAESMVSNPNVGLSMEYRLAY